MRSLYTSPDEFAHDVRLVWQNAIAYNSPHSMFGVVAGILAQIFDRRFALITRSATADPGRPIPDRPGWPTFQQKKKFYDLCTRLTLADLNQMVSLVQRGCQSAVQQCGDSATDLSSTLNSAVLQCRGCPTLLTLLCCAPVPRGGSPPREKVREQHGTMDQVTGFQNTSDTSFLLLFFLCFCVHLIQPWYGPFILLV